MWEKLGFMVQHCFFVFLFFSLSLLNYSIPNRFILFISVMLLLISLAWENRNGPSLPPLSVWSCRTPVSYRERPLSSLMRILREDKYRELKIVMESRESYSTALATLIFWKQLDRGGYPTPMVVCKIEAHLEYLSGELVTVQQFFVSINATFIIFWFN